MSQSTANRLAGAASFVGGRYTAGQAAALIARYQAIRKPRPFDGRCPYIGATPFRESDARLYFGHENQLEAVLDRVERGASLVCISGPAHAGKTSLIQAGVIFALRSGAILDSDAWLIQTLTPGREPMQRFASACAELGARAGLGADVTDAIRRGGLTVPGAMHTFTDLVLGTNPKRRLVLIVDQFEEIFTAASEEERRGFLDFITRLADQPPARLTLILVMRSEFRPQLARYPALEKGFAASLVEVPMMEPGELARAIVLPALEVGATIEPELVARLVNDVDGAPDMLIRLQEILRDLFMAVPVKRGDQKTLTLADYIDFGPLQAREGNQPATAAVGDAPAIRQPLRQALGEKAALSHFAQQEARLRRMKAITTAALAAGTLALAFGALGLFERAQFSQRADAAATAEAIAQAEATRAVQLASAAEVARAAAEAQATQAGQARQAAIATRTAAEAAATQAVAEQRRALDERATAVAIATGVVGREQNALTLETTASALATRASAETAGALAVRATAEVALKTTRSRELSAIALAQLSDDPQLALLIAIEAENAQRTPQSEEALRRAMSIAFRDEGAFRHPAAVTDAQFSPDGNYLLTASRDGVARLWEIASGRVVTAFRGHLGQVTSVTFSPIGREIATTSTDRTTRVWNLDSGRAAVVLVGHTGAVNDAAFSTDGRLLVTGGADRAVRTWDLTSGSLLTGPIQLTGVVSRVAFLTNGEVGALTADGAQRLDPRTGASLGAWTADDLPPPAQPASGLVNLYGHSAPASVADVRADRIVTVSADGTARIHLLSTAELVRRARALLNRELTCDERARYLNEALDCPAPTQ